MAGTPNSPDAQVLSQHPLFNGKTSVGMISGENPRFPAQAQGHQALGEALKQMGVKHEEREGRYGAPEKSYMVYGPSREQMYQLGKTFGQESVVYSNGGKHELLYTNGPSAGKFHPALDAEFFRHAPEDYYTNMPELGGFLRLNFDWDHLHSTNLLQDAAVQALHDRAAAQANVQPPQQADRTVTKAEIAQGLAGALRKALAAVKPAAHPHSYPWHNEHTDHHLQVASPGVVLRSAAEHSLTKAMPAHPHMDGSKPGVNPVNDQAAPVGTSTYGKFAMPYGAIDKANPTDLFHYPYQGKNLDIDRLVKDHGYTTYYAGGKYGRPDLANRNYNTKHLMIYDPSPESGASFGAEAYTDGWRKIHELAHALTYPELNQIHGEGRRIGKLGQHRTLREAIRAVHWEWLAAHKQRQLSQQIGVHVPDHVFHKELNTVMHDAIHRAVTGKFTEPSGEGFRPHEHKLPLEHALGMVRESAHNLGITGMHDLIKKNEGTTTMADDKVLDSKQWRQELAKGLRDRVDAYSKQMLELRQRELKKSLVDDPALSAPTPVMKPVDLCPLCGKEDVPGKCMCLQGPLAGMPATAAPLAQSEMEDGVGKPPEADSSINKGIPEKHQKKIADKDAKMPKPVRDVMSPKDPCRVCGKDASGGEGWDGMCGNCADKAENRREAKKSEPMSIGQEPAVKAEMCKSCGKSPCAKNEGCAPMAMGEVAKKEFSSNTKAKEPITGHKSGGNGIQIKALKKGALPGTMKGDALQGAHVAAAKPAAAPKLPGMAQHADRAAMFAQHMPAPAAAAPKPAAMGGAPKLPGMGMAASKPAGMPPAGVGGLKPPPLPKPAAAAAPALPKAAAPAAAPKPMAAAPKPAAAPAPMGKSRNEISDLKKALGSCALCNKTEHLGPCS